MTSFATVRDPAKDHLLTPQNSVLVIIDYQPVQVSLRRLEQAGGKPTSWVQLICELRRDWNRKATLPGFADILFAVEGH